MAHRLLGAMAIALALTGCLGSSTTIVALYDPGYAQFVEFSDAELEASEPMRSLREALDASARTGKLGRTEVSEDAAAAILDSIDAKWREKYGGDPANRIVLFDDTTMRIYVER